MNSDTGNMKSTRTVIDEKTGKRTTRKSEPIGTQGGPIRRLFGELPYGAIFTIGGKTSRIYTKLTVPKGSTANWIDGKERGNPTPIFVHISDDTEVTQGTM